LSRRGDCWDSAYSEPLLGSLKVQRLYRQNFETRRQAKDEIIDWLPWYHRARLHLKLAYFSPRKFEQHWHANQQGKSIRDWVRGCTDSRGKVSFRRSARAEIDDACQGLASSYRSG